MPLARALLEVRQRQPDLLQLQLGVRAPARRLLQAGSRLADLLVPAAKLQLYRIYPEKVVTPEGKLLARARQTPGGPQLVPVEDK